MRTIRQTLRVSLLALPFMVCGALYAQAPAGAGRAEGRTDSALRIGLALSGGGARGGAHVGVLRALYELRIPIDYIAGTSMGSVIGGLYASGLSEDELEEAITTTDWQAMFSEVPPRIERTFRRKRDDDLFLVKARLGYNDGEIQVPMGLIQGQRMDLMLNRFMIPVSAVRDFDRLAIPFRAIATDIVTGDAVVLGGGNLAHAIRASLSVPAIIAPIEIDGRLLVDGGIAMNLPVEVVRAMGADIIIAVDISTPLATREEITSALGITGQLSGFLTRRGTEAQIAQLRDDDILIVPELGELGAGDFDRIEETIPLGYEATMMAAAELRRLALDAPDYRAHREARPDPRDETLPVIEFVRLNNQTRLADETILSRMGDLETGGPLDIAATEDAIAGAYGLQLFQNVRYEVVADDAGTGLEITVDERSWGPDYLQVGLEFSGKLEGASVFNLAASYLRTALNEKGGEWRSAVKLGDEPGAFSEFYQPLGARSMFFFNPKLGFESPIITLFQNNERIAEFQAPQILLSLDAGRELGVWGEWRVGLLSGTGDLELRVGETTAPPDSRFRRGEFFTRFTVDTIDDVNFPREGASGRIEWLGSRTSLGADQDYDQIILNSVIAKSWGRHTLVGSLRFVSTRSGITPVQGLPRLGGFFDLSGYYQNELSGQHVGRLLGAYYRRIGDFALPVYVGFTAELGNAWDARSEISLDNSVAAGSLWMGVDTPLGPMYVAYGNAEGGLGTIYLFAGQMF